jgi:iron uptake system component EfeO
VHRAPIAFSAIAVIVAASAAACGGGSSGSGGGGGTKQTVAVTISPKGCTANPASIAAGPTTFNITNKDAAAISEAELMSGDTILGEKENLTPGLSGSFSLNVKEGKYQLYCPGAKGGPEKTDFVVTAGVAAAPVDPRVTAQLNTAASQYADYVRAQVAELVTGTNAFAAAVRAGDLAQASALYGAPRLNYERIEPVAESFGDLDPDVDARIDDVPDEAHWTGFHKLEKAIFADRSLAGMAPIADKLVADVNKLNTLVAKQTYQPAQIANGATELLGEVGKTKVTGEEERYSKLDLLDIQGNVDGADKAFTLLKPALTTLNPTLASTVTTRFTDMYNAIAPYRKGESYVSYDTVTEAQRRTLSQTVDALAEPLSQVAGTVVQ